MRYRQTLIALLAAAALSAPAAAQFSAQSKVYVPIGYSSEVILMVEVPSEPRETPRKVHASQFAYYAAPSFSFQNVPVRLTKTDFEIDCENAATRRLQASAFRDIDDRVGSETYSEAWTPIPPGDPMGEMRRLACQGISPSDVFYTSLSSAVVGLQGLFRASAD